MKNIIYDEWLSDILKYEAYNILVDENLIKGNAASTLDDLCSKKAFLYSKVPVAALTEANFLVKKKFNLVDTQVVLDKPVFKDHEFSGNTGLRLAKPEDEERVIEIARETFVFSRFHADKNFPPQLANTIKAEWARGFFTGKRGKCMVVVLCDGIVVGFLQLVQKKQGLFSIDLIAVDKKFQQKGIAGDMMSYCEKHCCGSTGRMQVATQLANIPSLQTYQKFGFRITQAHYVFHYHSDID